MVGDIWKNQICIGCLVEMPLGKELSKGIVSAIFDDYFHDSGEIEIKPIHSVLSATPLLHEGMLSMIAALSAKYYLPIHKALSLFLPTSLLSRLEKRNYYLEHLENGEMHGNDDAIQIHHFVTHTFNPVDFLSYIETGSVIVFPDDIMLTMFIRGSEIKKNILIVPNEMSPAKKTQAWIDIYSGKYSIIVGTRKILYYNLSAFKKIIYIEDAFGGEQFQYPIRLRSMDILKYVFETKTHTIHIVSSSPTLEMFTSFPRATIVSK